MDETVSREGLGALEAGEGDGGSGRGLERIEVNPRAIAKAELKIAKENEELWDRAVSFVRDLLREKDIAKLRGMMIGDPKTWWTGIHFGPGMALRNRLRGNGFGEGDFGIGNLDNIYIEILEEATRGSSEVE